MTHRDRFLEALSGGATVPPAATPLYLSLYLAQFRGRALAEVYREMAGGDGTLELTFEQECQARVDALARGASVFETAPAWCPTHLGPTREGASNCRVELGPGKALWYGSPDAEPTDLLAAHDDTCGAHWEAGDELPELEDLVAPDPWTAEQIIEAGQTELTRRAVEKLGDKYVMVAGMGTPYWHCYHRLGFVGMMRAMHEKPEVMFEVMRQDHERLIENAKALWHGGVRCAFVEECLSSSDLISQADFAKFSFAATREMLGALREIGFHVVYYFCGGVEQRLEHLAQLPANALAFEESKKDFVIDMARVRGEVGDDLLLFSNTDVTLLRDGSEDRIKADVERCWEAAGPRICVSMGSPATLDTPPEKLDMLMRAADGLA